MSLQLAIAGSAPAGRSTFEGSLAYHLERMKHHRSALHARRNRRTSNGAATHHGGAACFHDRRSIVDHDPVKRESSNTIDFPPLNLPAMKQSPETNDWQIRSRQTSQPQPRYVQCTTAGEKVAAEVLTVPPSCCTLITSSDNSGLCGSSSVVSVRPTKSSHWPRRILRVAN